MILQKNVVQLEDSQFDIFNNNTLNSLALVLVFVIRNKRTAFELLQTPKKIKK